MKNPTTGRRRAAAGASVLAGLAIALATTTPAAADPIGAGEASAFGATISVAGQEAVPPTPIAQASLPGDADETTVDVPGDPVAVSGTLNASASVHAASDIDSALEVETQEVAGPYNATAVGSIEEADVLLDAAGEGVSLVSADAIRAEAVAVCVGDTVTYGATSEVVNLDVGGQDVPLNGPITDLLDQLNGVLEQTTLDQVVDIDRNVVTELEDGIAVDALVVTVLAVAGDPVAQVRLGHAEVSGVTCGDLAECSDGVDNDGDGGVDFEAPEGQQADEHCDGPDDVEASQCTDGVDNADVEDSLADAADPGCPGDETQRAQDDDETDAAQPAAPTPTPAATGQLPRTGSNDAATIGIAGLLGAGALGALALRRRLG